MRGAGDKRALLCVTLRRVILHAGNHQDRTDCELHLRWIQA